MGCVLMVREEHDCEWTSLCCGAESHEYVDYFCVACNEATTFECNECPTGKDAEVKIESNN